MEKVIKKQNPPVLEDKICNICGKKIKVGIDYYYFVRDEQKRGQIICLECKLKFYPNNKQTEANLE
ncbi:hypothetical protein COS61_02045 [Candidatus Wolfebacteria bacterium CG03_land_8_20_14_0_80_40_12]|uniref:Uncharacterized protein n=1 Tax=Candidatus Wolfebacteria bacterium CG03_land_8_20_14_0_80_40_12 TaxID=1975069 RepID=A0A2M7B5E7_9BACT|nr:MAG: hypothetical protein COS61_02045 [Candidatus Wolfebacteria bacterium CG03_land_8_20_14_0_80_40_12]